VTAEAFDPDLNIRYYFDTASFLVSSAEAIDRELAEKTGRNFNIFDVFEVTYETLLSRILRELLDPSGGHGQGIRFLQAFIEQFEYKDALAWAGDLSKANVITERPTSLGRRIDATPAFRPWYGGP
jgi:hypothetical protein